LNLVDQTRRYARRFGAFLKLLGTQYRDDGCREIAASLTFISLFAIVPIMTVAFAILAALPALRERSDTIQDWLFEYFVPAASEQVQEYLAGFAEQASNLTGIGIVILVVTSVMLLRTIEKTMNRIWRVNAPRSLITSLLMYWAVLTLGPLLLGAGLGLSSYLTSVSLVTDALDVLGGLSFWLATLPFVFTTAMLALLYIVVPNCHVPIRHGLIGAAVAAVFFELAKGGFALFVTLAPTYKVVYGTFAAVPIFLMWIFVSWSLVLLGAELVRALVVFRERYRERPPLHALLRLLELLRERQHQGRSLATSEVRKVLDRIGASQWEAFRNILLELGLMRRADDGNFFLARDLREITLAELVEQLPWPVQQQLMVNDDGDKPWEQLLAERCGQAREGLRAPLDVSLEALFTGAAATEQEATA
jgi:membrane protein